MKVQTLELVTYNARYGKDPTSPLYVLNRTGGKANADSNIGQRGNLYANVINDDNSYAIIKVPVTFIPIDLTTQAPLHTLLKSTTLRQAFTSGALVIADPKSVQDMMANSQRARDEYKRLFGVEWRSVSSDADLDMSEMADADESLNTVRGNEVADQSTKTYSNNQIVDDLIKRSLAGESSDVIIASILNQLDMIPTEELQVIALNVTDSAVKDFCIENQ